MTHRSRRSSIATSMMV